MKAGLLFCFCLFAQLLQAQSEKAFTYVRGAVVRGDSTKKEIAVVFTGDEFGEGLPVILQTLKQHNVQGGFFFTGRFYRNRAFHKSIQKAKQDGHYLGLHSDAHLLYCDWAKRDSLLVTKDSFAIDIDRNLSAMKECGLSVSQNHWFIPPFEWWNDSITVWAKQSGLRLFNFSPGLRTAADYTWPQMGAAYKSSEWILSSVKEYVNTNQTGLNGAIILVHAGTDPRRTDKFYNRLGGLILFLKQKSYRFKRIDELLQ